MSRTMELTWENGFDPEEILGDFRLPFDYETITQFEIKAELDMTTHPPAAVRAHGVLENLKW